MARSSIGTAFGRRGAGAGPRTPGATGGGASGRGSRPADRAVARVVHGGNTVPANRVPLGCDRARSWGSVGRAVHGRAAVPVPEPAHRLDRGRVRIGPTQL